MSLPVYVDAYSGYKADERPRQFVLDEDIFEIVAVEEQWRTPDAAFFQVLTTTGKHCVLKYDESRALWTLQSDLDGAELLARTSVELFTVEVEAIRKAESQIVGCAACRGKESDQLFDSILADILGKHGAFEFVLTEIARCPNCGEVLSEKTLVEPQGGIDVKETVRKR